MKAIVCTSYGAPEVLQMKEVETPVPGDQVFGSSGMAFGAHAEYVAVPEDAVLALKPENMSYEEAAAIPFGTTAAMHFLRLANIQAGQKVIDYTKEDFSENAGYYDVVFDTLSKSPLRKTLKSVKDKGHKKGNVIVAINHKA